MRDFDFDDDEPYVVIEKSSGGIGSFLMGIAVGAGIALLMAPSSGMETRRRLTLADQPVSSARFSLRARRTLAAKEA